MPLGNLRDPVTLLVEETKAEMDLLRRRNGCWMMVVGSVVGLAGCWSSPSPPPAPVTKKAVPAPKPLLEGWKQPKAVLLLSGDQHGYFEPCGCSETQSGGMARRADLVRQIKDRGWAVAGLDAGGLLRRNRRQDQIKFETIWQALKTLDYQAVAMGVEEVRLGADFLLSQQPVDPKQIASGPVLLGSNLTVFDSPDLGTPLHTKIFEVGGLKIGVTAVFGASLKEDIAPAGVQSNVQFQDIEPAVNAAWEKLSAEQPDVAILISHGSREEGQELAKKFPQFQYVLASGGPEEPGGEPTRVGETWVIETGHKGKNIGVLGLYPGETPPARFELINLDNQRFVNDPRMNEAMRLYQQRLQDERLAESDELLIQHPAGTGFVGAAKCGECHTKAYAKWKTSKHARAFESLSVGRKGQEEGWVSRIYDPECLSCHVTGWDPQGVLRFEGGYLNQETTAHLAGQQCENCHGPGERHTTLEWQIREDSKSVPFETIQKARTEVKRTWQTAEKQICHKCHDGDNSPGFEFKKYWAEVQHPGRD